MNRAKTDQIMLDHFRLAHTDPSYLGSSIGEITDTDACLNYLDQLELTERSYLSTSEPETHLMINNTQQISDVGLDEGLGQPEEEGKHQKKITVKRKTTILSKKKANFNDISGDIEIVPNQMTKNILIQSRNNIKTERSTTGALYDPNEIINELTQRIHHHSKSSLEQEFQPLVKTHRPTILVEGEEYKEENSLIKSHINLF
mmetsp:Transcript_19471/g.17253  ORF Transcript_19471/g.17253 Transcript_19471/m.17253 type:complete len:202 (+) Transcript_19471:115-720(+)